MRIIIWLLILSWPALAADPNVVFILADDMGLGDVRCYTNTEIAPVDSPVATPNIDSIAAAGMRLTNAHSPSAVCSPTRYGVLTGRYAWRSRLKKGVVRAYERALIEPGRSTVGSLFQGAGYHTAAIGKWHLGMNWQDAKGKQTQNKKQVDHNKPILEGPVARGCDYYYGDDIINWGPFRWIENDRALDPKQQPHVPVEVMPTIARKSVAYITQHAASDKPFFLYVPLTAPHAPIVPMKPTPELETTYGYGTLKKYEQFIATVDWTVGQVLKALESSGVRDKTLIVFTADNGVSKNFASLDNISPGYLNGQALRGQKADIWEGGHRIPLLVEWKGQVAAGSTSKEYVELVDFYATMADLLSAEIAADAAEDSYSLLPVLRGKTLDKPLREAGVNHSLNGKFAIRQFDQAGNEWKLIFGYGSGGFSSPKGPNIAPTAKVADLSQLRLYNLTSDPGEKMPLLAEGAAPAMQAKARDLHTLLKRYVASGRSAPRQQAKPE
jgi:arylsulfatase A